MKKIELVKGEKGYDEMQIAVRGKGFMIAYITAIVVLALLTRFDETTKYINPYAEFVVTVWASMTVFSSMSLSTTHMIALTTLQREKQFLLYSVLLGCLYLQ